MGNARRNDISNDDAIMSSFTSRPVLWIDLRHLANYIISWRTLAIASARNIDNRDNFGSPSTQVQIETIVQWKPAVTRDGVQGTFCVAEALACCCLPPQRRHAEQRAFRRHTETSSHIQQIHLTTPSPLGSSPSTLRSSTCTTTTAHPATNMPLDYQSETGPKLACRFSMGEYQGKPSFLLHSPGKAFYW